MALFSFWIDLFLFWGKTVFFVDFFVFTYFCNIFLAIFQRQREEIFSMATNTKHSKQQQQHGKHMITEVRPEHECEREGKTREEIPPIVEFSINISI